MMTQEFDIAIVGGGPTGLVLANLLGDGDLVLLSGAGDIGGLAARLPEMLRQGGRG